MNMQSNKIPLIAIVGRTNVGKSTLFNLLADADLATVADKPGITRDRNYALLNNYRHPFYLVDTGGLLGEENPQLADAVTEQTEIAIHEADLIIAMFDGKSGYHDLDQDLVELLRKQSKPVIWVVNKCESKDAELAANEFYSLGIDELHTISAAHNTNIKRLFKAVWDALFIEDQKLLRSRQKSDEIKVAILGRPNAGKSTFVNKIIGEARQITSDIPGTTQDSVNISLTRDGQKYELIDTAGLRKRSNIDKKTVENIFSFRTIRSMAACDVAILMLDATRNIPSDQDAKIAELIEKRGKGLVIVVNKWDAIEKDHKSVKEYENKIREKLKFCRYAPIIFVSALTGRRCPSVLEAVNRVYLSGQTRIKTADLNKMIETAMEKNTPPIYRGQPVKFYFATQTEGNPPSFVMFFNQPKKISESYQRYLKNYIRAQHDFIGYDIKLILRKRTGKQQAELAAKK